MNQALHDYISNFDPAPPPHLAVIAKRLAVPAFRIQLLQLSERMVKLRHTPTADSETVSSSQPSLLAYKVLQAASALHHKHNEGGRARHIFYIGREISPSFRAGDCVHYCGRHYYNVSRGDFTMGIDREYLIDALCPLWNDKLRRVAYGGTRVLLLPEWIFTEL